MGYEEPSLQRVAVIIFIRITQQRNGVNVQRNIFFYESFRAIVRIREGIKV